MFCTKCGVEFNNELGKCPRCEEFENINETDIVKNNDENKPKIVLSMFCFIAAAVILILCFVSASNISGGGYNISQIESVGGRTLEEAYYHDLGKVYYGMSVMVYSVGIFFASILIYLGWKNIKK